MDVIMVWDQNQAQLLMFMQTEEGIHWYVDEYPECIYFFATLTVH